MKVKDSGHKYKLQSYDGYKNIILTFMKREGPGYPGNVGKYSGTNIQEVIRVLIDRIKYLDNQINCQENIQILINLREILYLLEQRAAIRHNRTILSELMIPNIELIPTCTKCGHIDCLQRCRNSTKV